MTSPITIDAPSERVGPFNLALRVSVRVNFKANLPRKHLCQDLQSEVFLVA